LGAPEADRSSPGANPFHAILKERFLRMVASSPKRNALHGVVDAVLLKATMNGDLVAFKRSTAPPNFLMI
jgi:hypothetical protein